MGAVASLSTGIITVEPGSEASLDVKVRNDGTVVDQFTFEVLGDAARWASVEPATLSLFPEAEGTARVSFRPPRSPEAIATIYPFGVRVASHEYPQGTIVEEGQLEVLPFTELFAELIPRTSHGRSSARHSLAIDNRGNHLARLTLSATDPDNLLRFDFRPSSLESQPGTASFAKVTVRARKRFLAGPPVSRPFQVHAATNGAGPAAFRPLQVQAATGGPPTLTAEGTMLQEPLVPRWLPKTILATLGLLLLAGLLWSKLLKPTVQSSAEEALKQELSPVKVDLAGLSSGVKSLEDRVPGEAPPGMNTGETKTQTEEATKPPAGGGAAGDAKGNGNGNGNGQTADKSGQTPAGTFGEPKDFRLEPIDDVGGKPATKDFVVPAGKQFSLTDFLLQNPQGDKGTLRLKRGDGLMFETRLENFRNLDYHYVTPAFFGPGQRLEVECEAVDPKFGSKQCRSAGYFNGILEDVPKKEGSKEQAPKEDAAKEEAPKP